MKYFSGKRRSKSRSTSSLENTSSTIEDQATPVAQESLNDDQVPSTSKSPKRMRTVTCHNHSSPASPADSETTHRQPSTKNRQRKQPSQKVTEHDEEPKTTAANKLAAKTGKKNTTRSKNQLTQQHHTEQPQQTQDLVDSESEGNNLSSESSSEGQMSSTSATASLQDKSTSSVTVCDHQIPDRDFLDRQVNLLKTTFELDDCPTLSTAQGRRQQRKEHIPSVVMHNALRKINYKVEDDLLCGLNRQAQRKFLQELHKVKQAQMSQNTEGNMSRNMAPDQHTRSEEAIFAVSEMTKSVEKMKEQLAREKDLFSRADEIVRLGRTFNDGTFQREVQRTNSLVGQIVENFKLQGISLSSCTTTPEQQSEASRSSLRQENCNKSLEQLSSMTLQVPLVGKRQKDFTQNV